MSDGSGVQGYVSDNMEGALDQAAFLARVDIPVAVIGPRGTGKFYVASTIHREAGGEPGHIVAIDCREFRNREQAIRHISRELETAEGKTLVFKSPHLMNAAAQNRLARQLSTRRLESARYLPSARFVGLFPERLELLVRAGELTPELASAFAGFPIYVPPIRYRRRAILRWANKILGQESRQQVLKGFSPDAEQAMMQHDWPGNITEMRQRIADAVSRASTGWITAADLDLFLAEPESPPQHPLGERPYLDILVDPDSRDERFNPSAEQELQLALGKALHGLIAEGGTLPLGTWLWDEVVLAAIDRYSGDLPRAGEFLVTSSRNLSRWQPKIGEREARRADSVHWREPRRLVPDWVREMPLQERPLRDLSLALLLPQVEHQGAALTLAQRAEIMGVSVPTYQKLKKQLGNGDQDSG